MKRSPRKVPPNGFTLVEVLLTLALAVVLITMVGTAMTFYADSLQTRDADVRRAQLASALLQMISKDLKATLHPPEFDDSALAEVLSSAGGASAGGSSESGSGAGEGEESAAADSALLDVPSGPDATADAASDTMTTADLSATGMTLQRPGLIGNQFQMQLDISRLPRLEEYQQQITNPAEGMADVASDIKTVTYFVQNEGSGGVIDPLSQVADPDADPLAFGGGSSGGLVRRQLDRLVTTYALDSGNIASLNLAGDLLAPEVVALEFAYFDGLQWQTEWNSDYYGGLPLAVQVQLTMAEPGVEAAGLNAADSPHVRTFRQIIRLPMSQPLQEATTSDTASPLSAAGV